MRKVIAIILLYITIPYSDRIDIWYWRKFPILFGECGYYVDRNDGYYNAETPDDMFAKNFSLKWYCNEELGKDELYVLVY